MCAVQGQRIASFDSFVDVLTRVTEVLPRKTARSFLGLPQPVPVPHDAVIDVTADSSLPANPTRQPQSPQNPKEDPAAGEVDPEAVRKAQRGLDLVELDDLIAMTQAAQGINPMAGPPGGLGGEKRGMDRGQKYASMVGGNKGRGKGAETGVKRKAAPQRQVAAPLFYCCRVSIQIFEALLDMFMLLLAGLAMCSTFQT